MTIKDMHYDFKRKLNKVDSQSQRNLLVPEIDWVLNEAQEVFIDLIAEPRFEGFLGFEKNQKAIDDLKSLVVNNELQLLTDNGDGTFSVPLPDDYRYYLNSHVKATKGVCEERRLDVFIKRHDSLFEKSPFDNSSFDWEVVNCLFVGNGNNTSSLKIFTDNDFVVNKFFLSYLRKPLYMHNAQDFNNNQYKLPNGTLLTGTQNCELPEHTHREIVDIAVMIVTGDIQAPDLQQRILKVNLNNIKRV
jgi:hypothetical protein